MQKRVPNFNANTQVLFCNNMYSAIRKSSANSKPDIYSLKRQFPDI